MALGENVRAPRSGLRRAILRQLRQALADEGLHGLQNRVCERWTSDAGRWMLDAAQRHVLWFCDTNKQYSALASAVCAGDKTGEFVVGLCNPGAYRSVDTNHISIVSSEVRPTHGNGPHGVRRCVFVHCSRTMTTSLMMHRSVARQGPCIALSSAHHQSNVTRCSTTF
jgi:hypothetical protein